MNDKRDSNPSEASHQNAEEAPASGTRTLSESGPAPAPDEAGTTSRPKTPREIIDATPCQCRRCNPIDPAIFESFVLHGLDEFKRAERPPNAEMTALNARFEADT